MPKDQVIAAAIDLGSNSFRLLIGIRTGQGVDCLLKKRATVRLARCLNSDNIFTPEGIRHALDALANFSEEINRFSVKVLRCCGTEIFRQSGNPEALTVPARKLFGVPLEILSGDEEALLSSLGVINSLRDKLSFPCLIVDIGGGSTELILIKSAQSRPVVRSLPIGAVMLAERTETAREQDLHILADITAKLIREAELSSLPMLVGTGGTAGSLATLDQELPSYERDKIQGYFLTRHRLGEICKSLATLSIDQLKGRQGLEAGREDIIMSGLEIYQEVLATIGCTGMMVSDAGLLEGILLSVTKA